MNKSQIIKQIKKIRVAFPRQRYYETEEDLDLLIALWQDCLGQYTNELVSMAVLNYIQDNTYTPTIADIDNEISKIRKDWKDKIDMLSMWIDDEEEILKNDKAPKDGMEQERIAKWKEERQVALDFKFYEYEEENG